MKAKSFFFFYLLSLPLIISSLPHYQVMKSSSLGEDGFFRVGKLVIHFIKAGTGEPLFLLPGLFSNYRQWARVIPTLAKKYSVYAIDLLGSGDSSKPKNGFNYTIEEQADIIANMIKGLNLKGINIAGTSFGGVVALNLSARYPELVKKIVSIEGSVVIPKDFSHPLSSFLKFPVIGNITIGLIKTGLLNKTLMKWMMGPWHEKMKPEDKKEVLEFLSFNTKSASRIAWRKLSQTNQNSRDFSEEAKNIKIPILYLYGEKSDFGELVEKNIPFFQEFLPQTRIVGFPDGIHDLQIQKPEEISKLLIEFFEPKNP